MTLKQIRGTDLVGAVRTLAAGESMLDPEAASRVMKRMRVAIGHLVTMTRETSATHQEARSRGLTSATSNDRPKVPPVA